MKLNRNLSVVLWLLAGFASYLFLNAFASGFLGMIDDLTLNSKRYVAFLLICVLAGIIWLYGLIGILRTNEPLQLGKRFANFLDCLPAWLRWVSAFGLALFPTYILLFNSFGLMEFGYTFRFGLILLSGLAGAVLTFPPHRTKPWGMYAAAWICITGAFFAMGGWLNRVTDYPFGLYWSEGNRFWDYSMLFASKRYITAGSEKVFTFISTGRQFIWALVFLIPNIGIFGVRLWDAALWIVPTFLVGFLAVAGVRKGKWGWMLAVLFGLWTFSFLSQGPIYAPLIISTLLVILAVRSRSLALGIVLLVLAGWYADWSRWTWRYAPGLWAGMLALMEIAEPALTRGRWKQFIRPVTLGLAGYLGGQFARPILNWVLNGFSGALNTNLLVNPTSSLTRQPLLWERLLPNLTYPPGILLGTIWAGITLVVLLLAFRISKTWKTHWLHSLVNAGIALLFLGIGIVISAKIGGGSNLHNLDMFWISLVLTAAWGVRSLLNTGFTFTGKSWGLTALVCLALISPASYLAQYGKPLELPAKTLVQESLQVIQKRVYSVPEDEEVLFIDQRQLLTFGNIQDVPLISAYEKKYLMDQAMSDNAVYFTDFIKDISSQRFAMIITEPIHVNYMDESERIFAQENNAWVKWVSAPLLCYYREAEDLPWVGVQILVPKTPDEIPVTCELP